MKQFWIKFVFDIIDDSLNMPKELQKLWALE